jgi:hypothetical protein
VLIAAVLVGVLIIAGAGVSFLITRGKGSSPPVASTAMATVPDFCALGGGVEFSPEAVSPEPIWYGDPKRLEKYRQISEKAGVKVEFVSTSSYGEEYWGGQAGWPRGQEPEPGATVPRGTVVKLVVNDDAESNPMDDAEALDAKYEKTKITTPEKGSPVRSMIMDAIRTDYGDDDLIFMVVRLRVMEDVAIAEVYPSPKTDDGEFGHRVYFLQDQSDGWTAAFSADADDIDNEGVFGRSSSVPFRLADDFFKKDSGLVRVPDMGDLPGLDELDVYATGYEKKAAEKASEYLSEYGLKSDYRVYLGEQRPWKQEPAPGTMVPRGTTVHVVTSMTG